MEKNKPNETKIENASITAPIYSIRVGEIFAESPDQDCAVLLGLVLETLKDKNVQKYLQILEGKKQSGSYTG